MAWAVLAAFHNDFCVIAVAAELLSPRREATATHDGHFEQFHVLAGIRRDLCL